MGAADRGSFMWLLIAITNAWLSIKLMDDVHEAVTTLFGTSAAAAVMIAFVLFRTEQKDLLMNPMKQIQKEVHAEEIAKQGKGTWIGVVLWLVAMLTGTVILP